MNGRRTWLSSVGVVAAMVLVTVLTGCGANSRPSADSLAEGLYTVSQKTTTSSVVTKSIAKCLAGELLASSISDEALMYLAKGRDQQVSLADKKTISGVLQASYPKCASK